MTCTSPIQRGEEENCFNSWVLKLSGTYVYHSSCYGNYLFIANCIYCNKYLGGFLTNTRGGSV